MTEDLGQSPQAAEQPAPAPAPAPAQATDAVGQQTIINIVTEKPRKKKSVLGAFIRAIIWIIVIVVVLLLALYVSAWIAGFTNADGWP
ncbi:MAG: hypothetical protein FWD43_06365, partial [Coriobacteriia bacterium]|nr:hypothetical protein [Coriobacteriia bacterium]